MIASNTRKSAREALAGKWKKGVLITLVYFLIEFLISILESAVEDSSVLSLVVGIANLLISVPISYGLISSFMKLKRGEDVDIAEFLNYGFSNFSRSWKVALQVILKMIIPVVLLIVCILIFVGLMLLSATQGFQWYFILGVVIYISVLVYTIAQSYFYSLAQYLAIDNSNMQEKDAVLESQKLMSGHRGDLFLLELSFIGWAILAVFTLGIGCLWLLPYMQVAQVCFYEEIIGKKESV